MGKRSRSTTFYVWVRDLHLYVGLFVSPFVLIFAISTLLLNHNWSPGSTKNPEETVQRRPITVRVPEGLSTIDQARQLMDQAGVSGEIGFVRRLAKENRLSISVMKPGHEAKIEVDLQSNTVTVEEHQTGFWEALVYCTNRRVPITPTFVEIGPTPAFGKAWRIRLCIQSCSSQRVVSSCGL
jgi:hypothetical protein